MNRLEKLTEALAAIARNHKAEIDTLPRHGPNGGSNAANIPGWSCLGNSTITRACGLADIPRMNYWSGSAPTPSTSIPTCIADEAKQAYTAIYAP